TVEWIGPDNAVTLTHGGTSHGAGYIAAEKYSASEIVDPGESAVGSLQEVLEKYDLDRVLPAMGYSEEQLEELEKSINRSDCDVVVAGTPIDLEGVIDVDKPVVQADYRIEEKNLSFPDILDKNREVLQI
ncbi:MAG: GTPase, partial [Candidatus Nanohaloarchaea archaeon]|nr:GTPase [Candidatus Nanohaloarchaea archaeon]